jgi:DNA-binding IclR family transcriptional regulator
MVENGDRKPWTFITNHTRVLAVIAENPNVRLRDIAQAIGITERATQRIVADLEEAGYLSHEKVGRRNAYKIEPEKHLRHELEQNNQIRALLDVLRPNYQGL